MKFELLGVTPGPVVSDRCAREMAFGAVRVLDVDAALAATRVGGPDTDEGERPGTVHLATVARGVVEMRRLALDGDPAEILEQTVRTSLDMLLDALLRAGSPSAGSSRVGALSAPRPPGTRSGAAPAG